jgi:hypothetical protein
MTRGRPKGSRNKGSYRRAHKGGRVPPLTAIITLTAPHHRDYLGPCLESLLAQGKVHDFVVTTAFDGDVVPAVNWANARAVSLAIVKLQHSAFAKPFADLCEHPTLQAHRHLVGWQAGLHLLPGGAKFVGVQPDTWVLRPVEGGFQEATPPYFHLGLPRRLVRGMFHYETRVVLGQASAPVVAAFDTWLRALWRLADQAKTLAERYGSLPSAAWHQLVSHVEEAGGLVLGHLPDGWYGLRETSTTTLLGLDGIPTRPDWGEAQRRAGLSTAGL